MNKLRKLYQKVRQPSPKSLAIIVGGILAISAVATIIPTKFHHNVNAYSCPCSMWSDSTVPTNPQANDPNPIELGMRFSSDVDGDITGVRFYKGSTSNGGTHIGNLWT